MLEYASIRLTLDWATPTTVPRIIVRPAIAESTGAQPMPVSAPGGSVRSGSSVERNTRTNAAKAAALTPVDMNPVTSVGAP